MPVSPLPMVGPCADSTTALRTRHRFSITADTALRLSRFFGTSVRFWLNLQVRYDLEMEKKRLADDLDREVIRLDEAS